MLSGGGKGSSERVGGRKQNVPAVSAAGAHVGVLCFLASAVNWGD